MCLAVPGKITEIQASIDPTFRVANVSFGGVMKEVSLAMLTEAKIGDYVLVHVGIALSVIDEDEAERTILALKEMGEMDF